ncbi:MAG: GC-type dockerin domain-anchored protein [Phycisphaerales bacterium]
MGARTKELDPMNPMTHKTLKTHMTRTTRKTQTLLAARPLALALLAGAAIATGAPGATAQDGGLSVRLDEPVISAGQAVGVGVHGHVSADMYALASVGFDVWAAAPQWEAASSGAMVGAVVLGASYAQAHDPAAGVLADPANPIAIWSGTWRPDVAGPAFLPVHALPGDFWVYPSDLTASSAPVSTPTGGTDWLMVDPIVVPGLGFVAPGQGTRIDVLPGGSIVAEGGGGTTTAALLLPAVQAAREAARRAQIHSDKSTPKLCESILTGTVHDKAETQITYTKVPGAELYEIDVQSDLDLSAILLCLIGPDGELICQSVVDTPVFFGRVPECLSFAIESDHATGVDKLVMTTCDDEPLYVEIPRVFEGFTREPVELRLHAGYLTVGDIKGESLEVHGEDGGVAPSLTIEYGLPCAADFDGDGTLTIFDFLAFQNAFDAGLPSADFDGDGRLSLFDFLAFQNAFDAGCP